ncbi:TrkA C-terminal domain-containing protein [Akkermansiaceae bacterium]|nr:TrkA C-terminal domain-containing protein [Akkermansiaceae bacterium]MDA7916954.1 TrkA C-terminal domain-containing protein [Akkermansiaceae bacterium]MDB4271554.1 TrkA C-terminal domain-containing protein [Akkermansiaceae bacterium]MDB4283285.1 TrkA C-terminal domain-containing protein [Akkermansiaceae bacterium]MDB4387412.1 TrkA C-terminal domain-containing protein [Akkermansiaceae bacterium]
MGPFLALVIIVLVALMLVRLGSSALQLTGMSKPVAQFQAASAFFGVGFTTKEAELVVDHPVRRRIILHLIIFGNIGLTSALATLLVTFMSSGDRGIGTTFAWLGVMAVGIFALAVLFNLEVVRGPLEALQKRALQRFGIEHIRDYDYLLNLRDGYVVFDKEISKDHPWVGKTFAESRPSDAGIVVLGIYRDDGDFLGAPDKDSRVEEGDVLMVYGRDEDVRQVFELKKDQP